MCITGSANRDNFDYHTIAIDVTTKYVHKIFTLCSVFHLTHYDSFYNLLQELRKKTKTKIREPEKTDSNGDGV